MKKIKIFCGRNLRRSCSSAAALREKRFLLLKQTPVPRRIRRVCRRMLFRNG